MLPSFATVLLFLSLSHVYCLKFLSHPQLLFFSAFHLTFCSPLIFVFRCRIAVHLFFALSAGVVLLSAGVVLLSAGALLLSAGAVLLSAGAVLLSAGAELLSAGAVLLSAGAVLVYYCPLVLYYCPLVLLSDNRVS